MWWFHVISSMLFKFTSPEGWPMPSTKGWFVVVVVVVVVVAVAVSYCYYCRCYYHHRCHLFKSMLLLLLLLLLLWLLDYFLHCTLIIASIKIFVIGIFKNHPCFQKMPSTNQDPGPFDVNVSQQRFFFRSKIMGHSSHHFEELLGFSCCTEAQLK